MLGRYFSHLILTKSSTKSVAQEHEGSSPHSQQPATRPYSEPVKSNSHPPTLSP
jgi:hypothetical protein